MILTIVSSTSCATSFSCGVLNIASSVVGFNVARMVLPPFLVNGDPAGQRGGDAHVFIEHLLGLLRLTDLEDQTFMGELHALLVMVSLRL